MYACVQGFNVQIHVWPNYSLPLYWSTVQYTSSTTTQACTCIYHHVTYQDLCRDLSNACNDESPAFPLQCRGYDSIRKSIIRIVRYVPVSNVSRLVCQDQGGSVTFQGRAVAFVVDQNSSRAPSHAHLLVHKHSSRYSTDDTRTHSDLIKMWWNKMRRFSFCPPKLFFNNRVWLHVLLSPRHPMVTHSLPYFIDYLYVKLR